MFCANCAGELELIDEPLQEGIYGGDYYTHRCKGCGVHWHVHVSDGEVSLMNTGPLKEVAKPIRDELPRKLREKAKQLEEAEHELEEQGG